MTASPLTIRPAVEDDFPAITAIYRDAVLNTYANFELEPPDEAELKRRWRAMRDRGYPYLVAASDGAVLGYAYAGPHRDRPAYRFTVENAIYVAPDSRRRGIGRRLLEALIATAEACGFRQMIAVIGGSDHDSSIGLHAGLGFEHAGTLSAVGYKHGDWRDTVIMQRPLGPGRNTQPDREPAISGARN